MTPEIGRTCLVWHYNEGAEGINQIYRKDRALPMLKKRLIFTNFRRLDEHLRYSQVYHHTFIGDGQGSWSAWEVFKNANTADAIILNIDADRLFKLCTLRYLFPFRKFKLISVDIVLRKPTSFRQKMMALVKSLLLKQVDLLVLYFKHTSGYEKYFGIQKKQIRYVAFKVNSWEQRFKDYSADPTTGAYVLCAGHTLRDLKTYIEAVRIARVPAVLLTRGTSLMQMHGTELITEGFPQNLRLETDSEGTEEAFLKWIKNAAIVVIPRFSFDISASGISTYLCSMAAWRCVVLSKGPGAEDLLTNDQAILVDPEDPNQLAKAMLAAWNDSCLRRTIAINGRKYVEQLQGEDRLLDDILKLV
ncbi:MAG: glycosyltransferase [Nitrososphaera sp.]|nr:glycosyltransferase [Nitrososphaera sp.]